MSKFYEKKEAWGSRGSGTLDNPEIIWLKEPTHLNMRAGVEQVLLLLAAQESLTHVWLRGGTPPYAQYHSTTTSATKGNIVDDDDHLTVYCRNADGQLREGHVYCVIDGQSGKFMDPEARKHHRNGRRDPVQLFPFQLTEGRKKNVVGWLLRDHKAWSKTQGQLPQQNA